MTSTSENHDETIHDQGFRDGVMFVAKHLRVAAERVEQPVYGTFQKDDRVVQGIARQGQPHLAKRYRDLADELERLVTQ